MRSGSGRPAWFSDRTWSYLDSLPWISAWSWSASRPYRRKRPDPPPMRKASPGRFPGLLVQVHHEMGMTEFVIQEPLPDGLYLGVGFVLGDVLLLDGSDFRLELAGHGVGAKGCCWHPRIPPARTRPHTGTNDRNPRGDRNGRLGPDKDPAHVGPRWRSLRWPSARNPRWSLRGRGRKAEAN